jgi:hypothetical protein
MYNVLYDYVVPLNHHLWYGWYTNYAPVPWRSATSSMGSTAKVRSILASIHIYVHIAIPKIDRNCHSKFILVGFNGILLFHLFDSFWGTIYISLPFARLLYTCVCIVLSWLNGSGIYHHISQLLACAWLIHITVQHNWGIQKTKEITKFGHFLDSNSYPISKHSKRQTWGWVKTLTPWWTSK